mmetsp:Transcript_3481/g.4286  ORF Transcript_3481/g.4286 Transcript_3481/m.4286 type:complete len:98 (-) Transcript_3481:34-327(-)
MEYALPFHPDYFETRWNILDRANRVKKYVYEYVQTHAVPRSDKIVLVGHGILFRFYTGKWHKEPSREEDLPFPDGHILLDNCQFVADPTDFTQFASF